MLTTQWKESDEMFLRYLADQAMQTKTVDGCDRAIEILEIVGNQKQRRLQLKTFMRYIKTGERTFRNPDEQKSFNLLLDTSGGYLMPTVPPAEILAKGLTDYNPIRDYATVRTLTAGDLYPQPVEKTRPGVRRLRETDSRQTPTSDMLLAGEMIPVHLYNATVPVSSKLVQDAAYDPDIFVIQPVVRAFLVAEGADFVTGSGVGCPEGIFTNGSVPVVHSGNASTITADSVRNTFYKLPAAFRKNSYWMMNDATIDVVKTLKDNNNQYIYHDGLFGLVPETLLGRPILTCPDAPSIAGGAFPIALGDLSRYVIVDRTQLAVLVDPYSGKPSILYDCVRRVGGQVADPNAFVKMLIST